jgi:NhaP-type Na+/H+ or K+/H+ antiporter
MQAVNTALVLAAAAVVGLGLFSRAIKGGPLSVPLLALGLGVAAGPQLLTWLRPETWPNMHLILKEAARLTLAISVMGIAIRTPLADLFRLARPVAVLLSVGMVAMWAVSSGLGWAILGLAPLAALLVGAAVTPTDPVVASAIVTGEPAESVLPDRLRSTISLESGANDGLGYLIVMLPMLLILRGTADGTVTHWLTHTLAIGIFGATAFGLALGAATGLALRLGARFNLIEPHSLLSLSVALSLLAVAGAHLFGADGILAAFAAGVGLNLAASQRQTFEEQNVQEAIGKLFNLPVFVLLGAALPWAGWQGLGWAGLVFGVAVLALRRPLALLVAAPLMGPRLARRDLVFMGWFGPVGVAALYYGLHATERTGDPLYWHATSLVIVLSVLAHGVTAFAGLWLFRRADRRAAPPS